MEPAWATEHYDFPPDPTAGDIHTAADNSEWTFDLHHIGEWDLSRYSPDEVDADIRLFHDVARKAPASNQTSRDQLAEILYKQGAYCGGCDYESRCPDCDKVLDSYAAAVLAAGWRPPARVITDPDIADRLPIGTVVMNDGGQVAQRYDGPGVWWQILDGDQLDSETLIGAGWIKVLHTPENGDTDAQAR